MLKPMAVRGEMDPKSDDIFFDVRGKKKPANNSFDSDTDNEPDTTYPIGSTLIGKPNKYIDKHEKTDLLDINCKQVFLINIDQIKKLYQQFNKVKEIQLDDNEIQIEGEQGRNINQLYNISDVDSSKDDGKIIVHLIDNEQFKDLIGCLNDGQRQLLYHTTNVIRVKLWGKGHPAMKVIVNGPAGTGKSMLIRALAQSVIRIANLRPDIDDLSLPPVL
ncbi:ATP-dependent DNA helicase [Aphis craccivora]|uniref:ATP-dependent DNA helicase n=1 Tax=Aphis craccivora TaxID=307492 RepID=A0A6G0Y4M9_APHCR|nr:ATP-dependent DNA helicase [Aphis craccivora]